MEQLTVNQLRKKHKTNRRIESKRVARRKKVLINDVKFTGGIILTTLSLWLMASIFLSL